MPYLKLSLPRADSEGHAIQLGWEAARAGKTLANNPHLESDPYHAAWADGFKAFGASRK